MSSPPDLCVRVTLPFQDCSGIIQQWYTRCTKAICYEHEADEEVSKTHVHLALFGLDCKTEALKRMWSEAPGKGNEFWSFTPVRKQENYLAYMTKGTLRPKLVKNFSPAEVEANRESWKPDEQKEKGDASQYYINKVVKKFDHIKSYSDVPCSSCAIRDIPTCGLLDAVRSETMKVFWGENRRVPHASMYKIVAGSVYLNIMERIDCLNEGIANLKNLWY